MKVLITGDWQVPYQDERAFSAMAKYARAWDPDLLILNGDILDFTTLTTKFVRSRTSRSDLVADVRVFHGLLRRLSRRDVVYLPGNHEQRLENLVMERADALAPLLDHELSLANVLQAEQHKMRVVGSWKRGTAVWQRQGLVVTHGHVDSPATAPQAMWKQYGSVVYGHLHRELQWSLTNFMGSHKTQCLGCMCNIRGEMTPPSAKETELKDWTQGFGVVYFDSRGYTVLPVMIPEGGSFIGPDGRRYSG